MSASALKTRGGNGGGGQLDVNELHAQLIIDYMRFARYQRNQRLRVVDACFRDVRTARLGGSGGVNFTRDEVEELLDGLRDDVRGEFDNELVHSAHTTVLLIRQLCVQAERRGLQLDMLDTKGGGGGRMGQLEDAGWLERVRKLEEQDNTSKLEPLRGGPASGAMQMGGEALLRLEIGRLEAENDAIKRKLLDVSQRLISTGKLSGSSVGNATELKESIAQLEEELRGGSAGGGSARAGVASGAGAGSSAKSAAASEMEAMRRELERLQQLVAMSESQLEAKVGETAPFKNLKAMLMKKNDQMKVLRARLSKYEEV